MTNTYEHAKHELDILIATDPNNVIIEFGPEILNLCDKFGRSGQSGSTAPFVATALSAAIKKLLLKEPISPVTGHISEWANIAPDGDKVPPYFQNNRCSAVFRDGVSKHPHYIDAVIFKDPAGDTFTTQAHGPLLSDGSRINSWQYINLPFTPKKFYIDVIEKQVHGETEWVVKDESQLEKVFKYYRKSKQE